MCKLNESKNQELENFFQMYESFKQGREPKMQSPEKKSLFGSIVVGTSERNIQSALAFNSVHRMRSASDYQQIGMRPFSYVERREYGAWFWNNYILIC